MFVRNPFLHACYGTPRTITKRYWFPVQARTLVILLRVAHTKSSAVSPHVLRRVVVLKVVLPYTRGHDLCAQVLMLSSRYFAPGVYTRWEMHLYINRKRFCSFPIAGMHQKHCLPKHTLVIVLSKYELNY
jgi:hypothetical protein